MQCKTVGRLPHALLCCGMPGLGKRIFAERLAQALLCQSPGVDGSPCGACRSCRLFIAGNHPDYSRAEPAGDAKPIRVDQVRELCAFLAYTSQFGGHKVVLLTPAERMNINAANSLLKTLEEPPANSLLLLISAVPSKLPATVRSRCQRLIFPEPDRQQSKVWLISRLSSNCDPELLLCLAGGSPLSALGLVEGDRLARRQELFDVFRKVIAGQADPVGAAELWCKEAVAENLRWLIGWYMDMIRLKMVSEPPRLFNPDLQQALRQLAAGSTPRRLFRQLNVVVLIHESCSTPINTQLAMESFLADCMIE